MSAIENEFSDLADAPEAEPASAPEAREPEPDLNALGERAFSAFEGEELEDDEGEYEDEPAASGEGEAGELTTEQAQELIREQYEAIANMSPEQLEEFREELEEWAIEDPLEFAEWAAAMGAEEARAAYAQHLDPIIQQHNEQSVTQTLDALRDEFGDAVLDANKEKLAEAIQRDPDWFADPDTQAEKLGIVLRAKLYEQRQRYERGEDVIEAMGGEERRDAFGRIPHDADLDEFESRAYPSPQATVDEEIAAIDNAHARFNSG
jgi:hypothetical protein